MMLLEEGKVRLTDPVSKFLPAFKNQQASVVTADPALARMTYGLVAAEKIAELAAAVAQQTELDRAFDAATQAPETGKGSMHFDNQVR